MKAHRDPQINNSKHYRNRLKESPAYFNATIIKMDTLRQLHRKTRKSHYGYHCIILTSHKCINHAHKKNLPKSGKLIEIPKIPSSLNFPIKFSASSTCLQTTTNFDTHESKSPLQKVGSKS